MDFRRRVPYSFPESALMRRAKEELDFTKVLRSIERHLPADAPVLLEHMETFEEYAAAYGAIAAAAEKAGIAI